RKPNPKRTVVLPPRIRLVWLTSPPNETDAAGAPTGQRRVPVRISPEHRVLSNILSSTFPSTGRLATPPPIAVAAGRAAPPIALVPRSLTGVGRRDSMRARSQDPGGSMRERRRR